MSEAAAPIKKNAVPSYFPFTFGKFQITVIYDGNIIVGKNLLSNVTPTEMDEMLARNFIFGEIPSSVNAYLINTGSKLILIDTGAGSILGPILGYIPKHLEAAGYKTSEIDAVLLTHCHKDHVGGLLDAKDKPVYPNATVYINKKEYDFWMSKENEAQAIDRFKAYFQLVQKTAPIYQAKGKWKTFVDTELPVPNVPEIRAIGTYGHTAGMTAYEITSEGKKFIIWGDIAHVASLQLPKPAITIAYDYFPDQAAASRLAILRYVSANKALVSGIHLPFPGLGHVRAENENSFSWVPVEMTYMVDKDQNSYY